MIKKKGRSGILNLTSAPKFGDDSPIPKANNTLNKRQKVKNGSPDKRCRVLTGLRNKNIEILKKSKTVFSKAENSITTLFTWTSVGPKNP